MKFDIVYCLVFNYLVFMVWCYVLLFSNGSVFYRLLLSSTYYLGSVVMCLGLLDVDMEVYILLGYVGWSFSLLGLTIISDL
jgi:hypothetical protein